LYLFERKNPNTQSLGESFREGFPDNYLFVKELAGGEQASWTSKLKRQEGSSRGCSQFSTWLNCQVEVVVGNVGYMRKRKKKNPRNSTPSKSSADSVTVPSSQPTHNSKLIRFSHRGEKRSF
jgi:hypothetical protein